jgi:hypothetical protein
MFKGILIALFIISLAAMLETEASAGCINIGGEAVCADWITGSEICSVTVATKGTISKGSTTSLDCGQHGCAVTCKVSGTAPVQTVQEKTSKDETTDSGRKFCQPGDEGCGILGFVFCAGSTKGEEPSIVRIPFTLTEANADLPLRATAQITGKDCLTKQNGGAVCQTSIELDPDFCSNCCPHNFPQFLTFTAQAFFGEVTVCPRNSANGECVSLIERCLVDPEAIRFGKSAAYLCEGEPSLFVRSR